MKIIILSIALFAPPAFAEDYTKIINQNLTLFTELKNDCVKIVVDGNQLEFPNKIEISLFEEHNEICGGDEGTRPRITTMVLEVDDNGKPLTLSDYKWDCDCYEIVKEFK